MHRRTHSPLRTTNPKSAVRNTVWITSICSIRRLIRFSTGYLKRYLEGDEPVFRGKRVHIGTDEYSNKKKDVVEKFRYFTDYYIKYVESFGKQACVWGALTRCQGRHSGEIRERSHERLVQRLC